jgi:hypothetical protein
MRRKQKERDATLLKFFVAAELALKGLRFCLDFFVGDSVGAPEGDEFLSLAAPRGQAFPARDKLGRDYWHREFNLA